MNKRLLIVDDEKTVRMMLEKALRKSDYEVVSASNGVDAYEILLTEKIDFCIIDYTMPYMNGLELIQLMQNNEGLKDIPFILLSAIDKKEIFEKATAVGVKWYLRKGDLPKTDLNSYVKTVTALGYI